MNRGDIYWVSLDPTKGSEMKKLRPCIIISADPINRARQTVIVIPLSSSAKARPPITISVKCLEKDAVAVCDQIRVVDKTRLVKEAGNLSQEELGQIEDGLRQVLML